MSNRKDWKRTLGIFYLDFQRKHSRRFASSGGCVEKEGMQAQA